MIPLRDQNPTTRPAIVTVLVIALCIVAYFWWQPSPGSSTVADTRFTYEHALVPCEIRERHPLTIAEIAGARCEIANDESATPFPHKNVWLAALVSMFLHGSVVHLGGNLLFLWIFGNNVEDRLGRFAFVVFYLAGGLVASAAHVAANPLSTVPVVGASGAIAAVMGAYLVWFPRARVTTLFFFGLVWFWPVQARLLLIAWFVLQFFTDPNSGVAWVAHVAGFVFGVVVGVLLRPKRQPRAALPWPPDPLR